MTIRYTVLLAALAALAACAPARPTGLVYDGPPRHGVAYSPQYPASSPAPFECSPAGRWAARRNGDAGGSYYCPTYPAQSPAPYVGSPAWEWAESRHRR